MDFFDKLFRPLLIYMITGNLQKMVNSVNRQTADLGGRIAVSPSAWEPTIWDMIIRITNSAIVPIAAIVLTFVMSIELVKWIEEKNNFHNPSDVIAHLIRFIIKLGIGVLLVTKSHGLTMWIFDLAAFAMTQSMGIIDVGSGAVSVNIAQVTTSLEGAEMGALLNLVITSMLGGLGMSILGLAVHFIVISRMIEIYIYCSMGGIPYATLMNKDISGMGQNYIKNLLALGFQGFFMFIMLGIYVALMQSTINNITSNTDPEMMVWDILLVSVVLVVSLSKSKALAKSIFGAQ